MKTAMNSIRDLVLNNLRNPSACGDSARGDRFAREAASYAFFLILIAATFVL